MKLKYSLSCLQKKATWFYTKPEESIPHPAITFLQDPSEYCPPVYS